MPLSPFDLAVAFIIVATMPVIIWVNYNKREGGLQGYLWRESPTLVWVSLAFLAMILLFSVIELLAHYGFLAVETEEQISVMLGIPMLVLSIAIIALAIVAVVRYLRARASA
jgi:hypothetical protein